MDKKTLLNLGVDIEELMNDLPGEEAYQEEYYEYQSALKVLDKMYNLYKEGKMFGERRTLR